MQTFKLNTTFEYQTNFFTFSLPSGETNSEWTVQMDLKWTMWMYAFQFIIVEIWYIQAIGFSSRKSMATTFVFWNDDVVHTPTRVNTSHLWIWIALIDLDTKRHHISMHIVFEMIWTLLELNSCPNHSAQFKIYAPPFAFHLKALYNKCGLDFNLKSFIFDAFWSELRYKHMENVASIDAAILQIKKAWTTEDDTYNIVSDIFPHLFCNIQWSCHGQLMVKCLRDLYSVCGYDNASEDSRFIYDMHHNIYTIYLIFGMKF